jgi:sugar/nucleoside kinase (ribokinase family)
MNPNSRNRAQPLLIVGSVAFDDLELPSGSFPNTLGGAATYAAYAASLFAPVQVVGVVGQDFPESVLDQLRGRGVDTAGIERRAGKTFRWAGRYADNLGSRTTLDTQLNVFADFRPRLPESYCDTPFVMLGNIQPALQLEVLAQAKSPRLVAADTMNFWISGERPALCEVLSKVDLLMINDEELRQLAEDHNIKRAARSVMKLGPKRLIVKRGEYGALLFDNHSTFFAPAYPLETEVDPTGAGDTFAGALLGYLAQSDGLDEGTIRRAVMIAATVASFCIEDVGPKRLATLTQAEIAQRLEELSALVRL